MEKSINYNQITIQNGKVEKIDEKHFKFTLKNEHDYPIILYKIWNNLDVPNNQEIMYKTTLESWVKLYKNYNFRNKINEVIFIGYDNNKKDVPIKQYNQQQQNENQPQDINQQQQKYEQQQQLPNGKTSSIGLFFAASIGIAMLGIQIKK